MPCEPRAPGCPAVRNRRLDAGVLSASLLSRVRPASLAGLWHIPAAFCGTRPGCPAVPLTHARGLELPVPHSALSWQRRICCWVPSRRPESQQSPVRTRLALNDSGDGTRGWGREQLPPRAWGPEGCRLLHWLYPQRVAFAGSGSVSSAHLTPDACPVIAFTNLCLNPMNGGKSWVWGLVITGPPWKCAVTSK